MFAREQSLFVQAAMLLHVRKIHEQIERGAGEQLVDVRILIRHIEARGPLLRAIKDDIARAHQFYVRRLAQMRQIHAGNTALITLAPQNDVPAWFIMKPRGFLNYL